MNTQPEPNVKLTFEQLQQLDIFQKKLANLESEISNATKILKGTKMESDRAVKELAYQEEKLSEINQKIESSKNELDGINNLHAKTKTDLNDLQKEIANGTAIHTAKAMELKDRENTVILKEQDQVLKEVSLNEKEDNFLLAQSNHEKKVSELKKVISAF